MPAIVLDNITKRYGDLTAVDGLNLDVHRGEILGFLGPNGAGKTTTIRILTGFLRPTSGRVCLLGHDMAEERAALQARASLGFVPDVAGLDATATGEWLLDDLAGLQGRPPVDRETVIAAMELHSRDLRRPMGRLSRGTRQKINIVQGLQHRPDLIILDEPAEGLDPLAKRALFRLLNNARERGATLFFSSHILSEVEELCDRVALIRRGCLVAVDEIATLRANLQRRVDLLLAEPVEIGEQLADLPGISGIVRRDGRWLFATSDLPATLSLLARLPVLDVAIEPPSLEEVFLSYYREETSHG
jgi:ABC-2 type transport system ATP-binding protein